jgi:hypothetical protein
VSELNVTEDKVRAEHLKEVNVAAHWAYFAAVLIGSALLMIGLIALLGASVQSVA